MNNTEYRRRVVPLYKPKQKKQDEKNAGTELYDSSPGTPPLNAHLTYNGGTLLENVEVYTIFWGNNWSADPDMQLLQKKINQFFTEILVSDLIDQLSEYNVKDKYSIGHGKLIGTSVIVPAAPQPGSSIDDSTIRSALQQWISEASLPGPTPNTLYFIYLDIQVQVTMDGESSCINFCGYHDGINNTIYYAVMPYPSCDGCLGGQQVIDALTGTSSHELCEAITDPVPPAGWYDTPNNMEIGDICAWTFKTVVGYNVQKEWSNAAKACI
jgi:hypothetical protein